MTFAQVATAPDGRPVFRQRHEGADGRSVLLYGYDEAPRPVVGEGLPGGPKASELRWHPLRAEWSVYAAGRQARTHLPSAADDPLAPARPGAPPTELPFEGFELAVFENRFPSLTLGAGEPEGVAQGAERAAARGACEVVVYGPEAEGSLATIGQDRRLLLLAAWRDRTEAMFGMGLDVVLPFENRGLEVGVTLHHPHGQIYGLGFVPAVQRAAIRAFADGYDLAAELAGWTDYVVAEAGGVVAFCPPYARFPYEVWLAPRMPRRDLLALSGEEQEGLAHLLGEVTARYDRLFERDAATMLTVHQAPRENARGYQMTAQFYPVLRGPTKTKFLASVEQATGVFTVDVLPERAAAELRAAGAS